MKIKSTAFEEGQMIPLIYSCDGDNINPPLEISEATGGAQSLALIMDDPDAPNGTFTHWVVWDINPTTYQIPENSVPEGAIQGLNSAGRPGYHGPCPPLNCMHSAENLISLKTLRFQKYKEKLILVL
jgi:Raf kinase inhibitor-like YbhB/YbcL family protein